jgi:hypothetical protein
MDIALPAPRKARLFRICGKEERFSNIIIAVAAPQPRSIEATVFVLANAQE